MIRTFLLFYTASVTLLLVAYVLATASWSLPGRTVEISYSIIGVPNQTDFCKELFSLPPYTDLRQADIDRLANEKRMIAAGIPAAKGAYLHTPLLSDGFSSGESAFMGVYFTMDNTVANHRTFHAMVMEKLESHELQDRVAFRSYTSMSECSALECYHSLGYRSYGLLEQRSWEVTKEDGVRPIYFSQVSLARLHFDPRGPSTDPFGGPYPKVPPWTPRGLEWSWNGRAWPLAFPLALLLAIPMYLLRGPLNRALRIAQTPPARS